MRFAPYYRVSPKTFWHYTTYGDIRRYYRDNCNFSPFSPLWTWVSLHKTEISGAGILVTSGDSHTDGTSWNRLPATIGSCDSLQSFKTQLKAHFFWWTVLSFPFISNAGALELDSMLRRLRHWRFIIITIIARNEAPDTCPGYHLNVKNSLIMSV